MFEKRLKSVEGGNCIIANLKSQLGRAKKELEEMTKRFRALKGSGEEAKADRKVKDHQGQGSIDDTLEADEEEEETAPNEGEMLEGERKANYQTQAARANYLCLDRCDIGFATKECMRRLSSPTVDDETALKKMVRYLKGRPRVVSIFEYGRSPYSLVVEGDSDHAGCARTRKSTSGGVIRWGPHTLKWWSKTQPTIALSSGEAELAAMVKCTSEGMGMLCIMAEFGIQSDLTVRSDAVAAIGIVKRQGLGRIRHLAVADLWIQQKCKQGDVAYSKLPGKDNTSDILTKPVEAETIDRHMAAMNLEFRSGRHQLAPAYTGKEDGTPCEK